MAGDPRQDLDEGALAGAVLAEQGVDLAGAGAEAGVAQRDDATEPLGNALRFNEIHVSRPEGE